MKKYFVETAAGTLREIVADRKEIEIYDNGTVLSFIIKDEVIATFFNPTYCRVDVGAEYPDNYYEE